MKNITKILLLALIIFAVSCQQKIFNTPTASTQASFNYSIEIIKVTEDSSVAKVSFTNTSINAKTVTWNFGNGQTSNETNPIAYFTQENEYSVSLTVTSENSLYYNKLSETKKVTILFKKTVFKEDFNNQDYLNNFPPTGWTNVDVDGDGQLFYFDFYDGDGYLLSKSYSGTLGALTPNNWFISPEIDLTQYQTGTQVFLYYTVAPTAKTAIYRTEHYSVEASENSTNIADFSQIFEETLNSTDAQWVFMDRRIDISQYAGKKVRLAFRHNNSTDKDRIAFSDFEVYVKF